MPIEKTVNFIRIRVANPKGFIRFRVKTLGKGIKAVIGFKKGGGSQIQSVLFPRSRYTLAQAKAWVKSHGHSVSETFVQTSEDFIIEPEFFEAYLVHDIIIDPKTLDLIFIEQVTTEEEEAVVPRPKRKPWEWMFEPEFEEWELYE